MYYNHDIKKKGSYGVLLLKTSYKYNFKFLSFSLLKGTLIVLLPPSPCQAQAASFFDCSGHVEMCALLTRKSEASHNAEITVDGV